MPAGEIKARTKFQRERLTKAVTAARLYLEGGAATSQMAVTLGVTEERIAQMVRLGISYMQQSGWLQPEPEPEPESASRSSRRSSSGRAHGLCSRPPRSEECPSDQESRGR